MYSNKKLFAVLMASVLMLSAVGCSDKPTASSSETIVSASSALPDSSSSSTVAPIDSPKLEPVDPILVVYSFQPDGLLYTKVEAGNVPSTLLDVVNAVAKTLELPEPQVTSITQQKGMVSLDFDKAFAESYTKQEVYRFLDSLGMTLSKNHRGFETIVYTLGGESGGMFGEGPWKLQPLKLVEGDAATFKAMRDTTAYSSSNWPYNSRGEMSTLNTDPVAKTIADLLSAACITDDTFANPAELPAAEVVRASIEMTQGFASAGSVSYTGYPTSDAMEPIYAAVSLRLTMQEDMVWVQEHVEQSAKLLYGPDFVIEHQSVNKYTYFAEEGVYTPPHMGTGFEVYTAVHDYTDNGDTVTATVSYAIEGMGGIFAIGGGETTIAPEKLADHLTNDAVRHTVTLRKNADGSMYIVSQQPA